MELTEAVRLAVARTGHARYAELLNPAHPDYNPVYEPAVRAIAEGTEPVASVMAEPAPDPPTPVFSLATIHRLKPLAAACPYATTPTFRGCGCRGCAHLRRDVSLSECLGCVAQLVRL